MNYNKKDNHSKPIIIGTISFGEDIREVKVDSKYGRFNTINIGECNIEVYSNEGPIPHFHISNLNKTFNCCIRIYENKYFSHGGKYRDILNSRQRKQLNDYLKQISKDDKNKTVWEYIVKVWESETKYAYSNKTDIQPHYENMREFNDSI